MPAQSDAITIAFGVDANYARHAAAVISSVIANSRHQRFRIIVLHTDVDAAQQAAIEKIAPQAQFVWRAVGDDDLPEFETRGQFTRATLFRLGLEKMAPSDCSRLIYLDADIAVIGDVADLWSVDLGDNLIGAVADEQVDARAFAERWSLPTGPQYFNAGVLLVDLDRVRAEGAFSAAANFVAEHDHDLPWNDQDGLNWICWSRWRSLDPSWNVQRNQAMAMAFRREGAPAKVSPRIVHYTGADKPWNRDAYHPWAWLYWRALSPTGMLPEVAAKAGVSRLDLLWLRFRWLRRRPVASRAPHASSRLAPPREQDLDVSLIICTRNRASQLTACLEEVKRLQFEGAWEIVVVDNGSTDGTSAVIDAAAPDMPAPLVKVLEPKPGLGLARNAGIAAARGRIIIFTDDDCYVSPDFVREAVRAFDDPDVGYATGRVELFDPTDAPVTVNPSRTPRRYPAHEFLHSDGIIGANLAFRRQVLDELGGFDMLMGAGTIFASEDVDAAARAGSLGWVGVYRPEMVVAHHHGRKAEDVPKLYKSYDIGRGAYIMKYLLRGEFVAFLKGVASVRWRLGPPSEWRLQTLRTPMWELYGAMGYAAVWARRRLSR